MGAAVSEMIEADYNLSLCRQVKSVMGRITNSVICPMTRTRNDEVVSLDERGKRAYGERADFVVCVHVDKWSDSKLHGASSYYAPSDGTGEAVADVILRSMPPPLYRREAKPTEAQPDTGREKDRWLQAPLNCLSPFVNRGIPACLIECGFMSNDDDLKALLDPEIQMCITMAIINGLMFAKSILQRASWAREI